MPQVKLGSTVLLHYTAMLKGGEVVTSTAGGEPVRITVGAGKLMRGVEEALVGMSPGESKHVIIPPEKGTGRRKPEAGSRLSHGTSAPIGKESKAFQQVVNMGRPDEFSITVTDKAVRIDNNPHLAGKELVVDIDLVDIII